MKYLNWYCPDRRQIPFDRRELIISEYLAIADIVYHRRLGVLSHQPDISIFDASNLRMRKSDRSLVYVNIKECRHATLEEKNKYWAEFNKVEK